MSTTDSMSIAQRAARGSVALIGRQVVTLVVTFFGGILLARLLTPSEFGAYALIVFIAGLTKLLTDGGLAASLIQQPHEPTHRERSAVFSIQMVTAVVLALCIVALAPYLETLMGVPGTMWSLWFAALAVLAAPLTSISFVVLERNLDFSKLGLLLLIQPVTFNLIAVWLAVSNFGVLALGIALAASNILVVPAAVRASRDFPSLLFGKGTLTGRFRFGLPYIGVGVISTVKDSVNPMFIGIAIGATAAGYVNWAQQVAVVGTYTLVIVSRLLFPVLSRVKDNPAALGGAISKVLFWANAMVAPITIFLAFFATDVTEVIYGAQWLPAVPMLYFLLLANLVAPASSVLMALMNALGKPLIPLWFAIAWFVATWALVPWMVTSFGVIGYGYANAFVQIISVMLIFIARRHVRFAWVRPVLLPWLYAAVAFAVVVIPVRMVIPDVTLVVIIGAGAVSTCVFVGLMWLFSRENFRYLFKSMFR